MRNPIKTICILLFITLHSLQANQSLPHSFLGFEAGYVMRESKIKLENATITTTKLKDGWADYGFVGGVEYVPNYFGVRFYANANFIHKDDLNTMIFGINFDGIVNFLNTGTESFGVFAGVFLGGNLYWGDAFDTAIKGANAFGIDASNIIFDVAINAGLRGVIARRFVLELATRVPLVDFNIIINPQNLKVSTKHYTINLRFSYLF